MSHLGEDQVYGPFRQGQGTDMRGGGGKADFLIRKNLIGSQRLSDFQTFLFIIFNFLGGGLQRMRIQIIFFL